MMITNNHRVFFINIPSSYCGELKNHHSNSLRSALSFLAHGPKNACGDVCSLLCVLCMMCVQSSSLPRRRAESTGPARASFFACVERDRDQEERQWRFCFSVCMAAPSSCLVHKPTAAFFTTKLRAGRAHYGVERGRLDYIGVHDHRWGNAVYYLRRLRGFLVIK